MLITRQRPAFKKFSLSSGKPPVFRGFFPVSQDLAEPYL
jgi:hypothetical protein